MKVFLLLADGFETIEALTPVDVFHRIGNDITTVSITESLAVRSSHGVEVKACTTLAEADFSDGAALILPGGFPGYRNLCESEAVGKLAKKFFDEGRLICAICGAPTVLKHYGIGTGLHVTCHHSVKDEMEGYRYTGADVEHDKNLITAIGAGHSIDFSLEIVRTLFGDEAVAKVKHGMELK
jgi:4-methyl-5(b-hydroxyethyl)-thiazole monophosphate biosynthesis